MSDPFRAFTSGEPLIPRLTADYFNGLNHAVQIARGGDIDLANESLASTTGSHSLTVNVTNKSGQVINRPGGVLKLENLAFSFVDKPKQVFGKPNLKGVLPTTTGDEFVITTTPLKNNQPGKGVILGFAFCRLNYTDTTKQHKKAALKASTVGYLESGANGVSIFWREKENETGAATTGEQWALVLKGATTSGETTISGVIGVASQGGIGAATLTNISGLTTGERALVDPNSVLPGTTKVWKLQPGTVELYDIKLLLGGQTGQSVLAVFASPQINGQGQIQTGTAYNTTANAVAANKLLQLKKLKTNTGEVFAVDVEPCG